MIGRENNLLKLQDKEILSRREGGSQAHQIELEVLKIFCFFEDLMISMFSYKNEQTAQSHSKVGTIYNTKDNNIRITKK